MASYNEQQLKRLPLKRKLGKTLEFPCYTIEVRMHAFGYSYVTIAVTFRSGYARLLLVL